MTLAGKNILVLGGTRGLGAAVSECACGRGGRLLATHVRDVAKAEGLLAKAKGQGWDLQVHKSDLTSASGVEKLLSALDDWLAEGRLDGVVFCAATGVHKPVSALTTRHFDWTFGLNVRAFFELTRQLLPRLSDSCSIVPVSSHGARRTAHDYSLVGATKAALESLSRHLAMELGPNGVRVNILCPGTMETDVWKALPDAEKRLDVARTKTSSQRLVTLNEVAEVACFLLSESASGMNGATVVVDRGESLPL